MNENLEEHPCVNCKTPPYYNIGHPIIYCGKDCKNSTILILDMEFHLNQLYENCPDKGDD